MGLIKKKRILISFVLVFLCFYILAPVVMAVDTGLEATKQAAALPDVGGNNIPGIIGKIIGAVLAFVGIIFFVLIIYGGFTWMFSRGNEQDVEKAKNLITSAVIGLIIVLAAYAITSYLGNILTK